MEDEMDENDQRQHRQVFGWYKDDDTVMDAFTNLQVTSSYNALPCYTIGQRLVLRAKEENVKYLTVCIPCYNEDKEELYKTMLSLMQNADFCKKARCSDTPAGMSVEEEFQKTIFVLVPIFDGIRAMDDSMKEWLAENFKGIFDDLLFPDPNKNSKDIDPDEVVVRVACRRWWYYAHDVIPKASDSDEFQDEEELFEDHLIPFYMLPIVKKVNHRKHNSHQWFFDCVCMGLKKTCTYAFLTDCGTTYEPNCVAILFKEVIVHSSLIGVTARQRVEWPNKYYHPCENAPFSCWKGDHTASKSKKPCWKCYVSFFLSPCPLQGFEFEASLITNLSIFNLVEALPVMPGPCQLLNWQKMKHFQIVKEYFNLLFKAEVNKKQKIAVPTRYHKMIDDAEGEDDSEGEGEKAQLLPSGVSRDVHTAEGGGVISDDDDDDDESEYEEYEEIEEFDYSLPQMQHSAHHHAHQFPSQYPTPPNAHTQYSAPRSRNSFASNSDVQMSSGGYDQIYHHGGEVELAPYPYPNMHAHAYPGQDQHSLTNSKLGPLSVHSGIPPPPPRSLNSSPSMYGGMVIPPPPPMPPSHAHMQPHAQMHTQSPPTRGVRVVKRRRRIQKPPKPPKQTQPPPSEPAPQPAPAPAAGGHGHGGGEQKLTFTEFLRTNMRLAEDRVLSFVGVFSTRYGTKWVPGATFYYTPEITWQTLLLQRRRWINGTLASYFFFLLSRRAKTRLNARTFDDQSSIKFMVLFLWRMQLFQLLLVFIAPAVFGSTFYASLIDCAKRFPSIFGWAADPLFPSREDSILVVADLVVFIAFVLYAVWTISSHYLVGGRMPEYICQIMATLGFIYMIPIYWSLYSAIIMLGISFVVILVFLSLFAPAIISIAESTKCMQLYVCYFPWFAALTVFFLILMPSYSLARLFDTSWGNRATGSDSAVAKHEEVTMKRWNIVFIVFIVGMNFAVTIGLQRILVAGYTAIMTVMIVVFVPSIVQLAGAILFWIKTFIQRNELNVPFLNDTSRTARRAAFAQLQQQKALQALLAKERERAQALETQLSALQQEHSSQQDTQSQHTGDDEDEGGMHEEEEDEEVHEEMPLLQQPVQHMMPTQQHVQHNVQLSRRPSFASVASVHTHTHSAVPPPPPPPPHTHSHAHNGFTQVPPPPPQQHVPQHNAHTQQMAPGVHEYNLSHSQAYAHNQPPPQPHTMHTHNGHAQAPPAQQRRSFSLPPPPPINTQMNGNMNDNYPMSVSPSAMKKMLADPSHAHNAHTQHLPMAQAQAIDDSHSLANSVAHSLAHSVAHSHAPSISRTGTPRSLSQQKALSNALPPGFTETLITPHNGATQHAQQQTQPSPLIHHHQQRLLGMHTQQTARPPSAKPLPPLDGSPLHHTSLPHMSLSAENLTHSTLTHPQTLAHSHSLNSLPLRHSSSPGTPTARRSFTQLPHLTHLSQTSANTHVDSPRMALIRQRERELEKERESERERERQRERDIERLRAMEEEMAREEQKLRQMNRVPSGDSHTLSQALSQAQSQAYSHALSQAQSSVHSLSDAHMYSHAHAHAHAELADEHSVEAVPVAVEVQAMPVSMSVSVDEKEGDDERESDSSLFFSPLSAHTHDTEISERDNPMLHNLHPLRTHAHAHAYPQAHNGLWRSPSLSSDDGVSTSTQAEEKDSAGMVSERERSVRLALVTPQRESHTGSHTDMHAAEGGIAEFESPSPFASAKLTPSTLARVFSNNTFSRSEDMISQQLQQQSSFDNAQLSHNGSTTMLTLHLHENNEDYENENENGESETIAHSAISQHSQHSQHSQSYKRVLRVGEEAERRASSDLPVSSSLSFSASVSKPVTPTHSRSRLLPAEFNSGLPLSVSIPFHEDVTERDEALYEHDGEQYIAQYDEQYNEQYGEQHE